MGQSGATDWREVGRPFFERIGAACDRIAAHYPEIAEASSGSCRGRVIRRVTSCAWPTRLSAGPTS